MPPRHPDHGVSPPCNCPSRGPRVSGGPQTHTRGSSSLGPLPSTLVPRIGRSQDSGGEGRAPSFSCGNSSIAARCSTTERRTLEPQKYRYRMSKTKKKPQQKGRRGAAMGKSIPRSRACSRLALLCFWAWGGRTDGEAETQAKTDPGQRATGLHAGLHPRDRPCWLRAWDRLTTLSPGRSWRREGSGPVSKGTATMGRDPLAPGLQEDLDAQCRVGWGVPWGLSCLCSRTQGSAGWAGGAVGPEPCGKGGGRGQSGMCPPGSLCWTRSDPRAACSAHGQIGRAHV